jgi:hypothetical protein
MCQLKQSIFTIISMFLFATSSAQYNIEVLDTNCFHLAEGIILSKTSFRGLSVVDDNTIWVSGSRGTIARSTNGGKIFVFTQLKGYEKSDFRDIEAFDEKRAIIMSSGTPALIMKTTDGGQAWKEVFRQNDSAYFLDAMDFWDEKRGIIVGDPINGHFVLLQTTDGGESWQELDTAQTPKAMEGEAVFAASGTSLRCWGKSYYGFVAGGGMNKSHLILMNDNGSLFKYNRRPSIDISYGSNSRGAFSFVKFADGFAIVGGDYLHDTLSNQTFAFLAEINYPEWQYASNNCYGYRSCIEVFNKKHFIACGTSGVDVFVRPLWQNISREPFHVVRKAKKGSAVFLAGPNGKIGKLVY